MNLFDFNGPRVCLTFCCFCTGMTIESLIKIGTNLVARGKIVVIDTIEHGPASEILWIAELTQNADWNIHKPKTGDGGIGNDFDLIDSVNRNIKCFILRQLKRFCEQDRKSEYEIEHDPADDLTPDCVKASHNSILRVHRVFGML